MPHRVRVLHIITTLGAGGAERSLTNLVTQSPSNDFEHYVIALTGPSFFNVDLSARGIEFQHLALGKGIRSLFEGLFKIRAVIKQWRPDILQGWLYHGDFLATLIWLSLPKGRRPKLAWNIRCSKIDLSLYSWWTRLVVRCLASLSSIPDLIIHNSLRGRNDHEAIGYKSSSWAYLPNGIDTEFFHPMSAAKPENLIIGCVGRVDPMKGHDQLLRAFAMAFANQPTAKLLLIGSGTMDSPLIESLARSLGVKSQIIAVGPKSDIREYYNRIDIFCLPSISEGFPNVLGEAMACGLPAVSFDVGDAAQVLGEPNFIIPAGDIEAFAKKLKQLAELTGDERRKFGERNRKRIIDNYSIQRMVQSYGLTYSRLVGLTADRQAESN